jgi:hypothetical protein
VSVAGTPSRWRRLGRQRAAGGSPISSTLLALVLLPIVYPGSAAADERPTFPA